jgi:metallo-beta-lactamase class B
MLPSALLLAATLAGPLFAQSDWNDPFPPHRIADNLYYVGSKGLSTYLITSKQGHILINASFDRTVPIIRANVEKLGFKMTDVKIILSSHAHGDHVEGTALLKEITGAEVWVMKGDDQVVASGGKGQYKYPDTWKPVKVSKVLQDGETVKLGDAVLTARHTPGHTRGNTTWTMTVTDKGKKYLAVIIGSPNVNPGYELVNNREYPEIATDFARTFQVLESLPCDIFLGAHGDYYGMAAKFTRLKPDAAGNPFVDPEGYKRYVANRKQYYLETLAKQKAQ